MHMNLNYASDQWTKPGENQPLGLILCAEKGAEEARYALENLPTRFLRQSGHTFALCTKSAKPPLCSGGSRGKVEGRNSVPDLCCPAAEMGNTDDVGLCTAEVSTSVPRVLKSCARVFPSVLE